jgi:hypothetical protein
MLGHMLLCGPLLPVVEEAVTTLEHHVPVALQMKAANITPGGNPITELCVFFIITILGT